MDESLNEPIRTWSDEPRPAGAPDDLGRESFVRSVGTRIDQAASTDPSTVFGLLGPWGSGKTSILAALRKAISDDWLIGEFTPWSTDSAAEMSFEFLNALGSALGKNSDKSVREAISKYAGYITPLLALAPVVGSPLKGVLEHAHANFLIQPPWQEQFATLSSKITSLNKRVLIIVDDVDRLSGNELQALLKTIRLLGRFRGVHYLISYDPATVVSLLGSGGVPARANSFMEKIVQYPFEVPPVGQAARIRLINAAIQELLERASKSLSEVEVGRASQLVEVLAPILETPRAIGRFREQLNSFASHVVDAELDILDYAAISWLRLNAHRVWRMLGDWQSELRRGRHESGDAENEPITTDEWIVRVASVEPGVNAEGVVRLLSYMYPGVTVKGINQYVGHERAASDESYLQRYLLLAVPEGDVSDRLIEDVLNALAGDLYVDSKKDLASIMDGPDWDLATLAFSKSLEIRKAANTTSLTLIDFLRARVTARDLEDYDLGSPIVPLKGWMNREIALGIRTELLSIEDVVQRFGEAETVRIINTISRMLEFKNEFAQVANKAASYWIANIRSNPAGVGNKESLAPIIHLVYSAPEVRSETGLLDDAINSFEDYVAIAQKFVIFNRWVGSGVHYEMEFMKKEFEFAVSEEVRDIYRDEALEESPFDLENTEELAEPDVAPEIMRAFTLRALAISV
ncbi:P-loop NTPase fold protein [Microcella daejeonensis]|uniref:KAP family P-loop NTPase fold protein n=1 Tax=Microcella daejeonensis TaxID=2994971 RepID=UPI00226D7D12|nr:P-loop NTPase fold protein [Microcella daejeonensis]WAB85134.1 P-loop NTPase fold protein [Microcella daejeonensis]